MAAKLGFAVAAQHRPLNTLPLNESPRPVAVIRKVFMQHGRAHPLPVGRAIEYATALAPALSEQQIRTAIKVLFDAGRLMRREKGIYQADPSLMESSDG